MGSSVILPSPGQPQKGPDKDFKSGSTPNIVTFRYTDLTPPSPFYIQRGDEIAITAMNNTFSDTVIVSYRILVPPLPAATGQPDAPIDPKTLPQQNPTIVFGQTTVQLPTPTTAVQTSAVLTEGFLLSVSVSNNSLFSRGLCYARVYISRSRNPFSTGNTLIPLIGDYITPLHPAVWPNGPYRYPTEGPGDLRVITVANPAVGSEWALVGLANTRWRIHSFNAQLIVANAGTPRIPRLIQRDTGAVHILWQAAPQQAAAINTTVQVSGSDTTVNSVVDTTTLNIPLPAGMLMQPATSLITNTLNLNAGDQWQNIAFLVEQWCDNI